MKLAKPIEAHGETLKELTFTEPSGKDLIEAGLPFTVVTQRNGEVEIRTDAAACARLASRLAQIPPSSVAQLCAYDFWMMTRELENFFTPPRPNG